MTTLKSKATVIKNETTKGANTATRVGGLLENIADSIPITVGTGQQYTTIAAAIAAATAGQKVVILSGTYTENITAKDGVIIEGASAETTEINGTFTFAGKNEISNLFVKNMTAGAGVDAYLTGCKIGQTTTTQKLVQTGGNVTFDNCVGVYDGLEPSVTLSGSAELNIINCKRFIAKVLQTDNSVLNLRNSSLESRSSGNYAHRLLNNSICNAQNANYRGWVDETTQNITHLGINLQDDSKYFFYKLDTRGRFGIDNGAQIIGTNYKSMYGGRLGMGSGATSSGKIDITGFYIHMDNGFQQGSHIIEASVANPNPRYILKDGTLEYMGDKGEYPMAGNVATWGTHSNLTNVIIIDHGSVVNESLPGGGEGYERSAIYGLKGEHDWKNVHVVWKAVHSKAYVTGAIRLNADTSGTSYFNFSGSVTLAEKTTNRAAFVVGYTTIPDYTKINLNVKSVNCDLFSATTTQGEVFANFLQRSLNQSEQYSAKSYATDLEVLSLKLNRGLIKSDNSLITDLSNIKLGTTAANGSIQISDELLINTDRDSFKNLSLALPKQFFKAKGRINLKNDDAVNYPNGYAEYESGEKFDLYTGVDMWFLIPDPADATKFVLFRSSSRNLAVPNKTGANGTPVATEILNTEYYIAINVNASARILGLATNADPFTEIWLILDRGVDYPAQWVYTHADIMMNVTSGTNELYNVKFNKIMTVNNVFTATAAITKTLVTPLVVELYPNFATTTAELFGTDALNRRYSKIKFPNWNANNNLNVRFDFLQAINIKDAWISRTGEIY